MEYIKLSFGNALGDEAFTPIWDYLCLVCTGPAVSIRMPTLFRAHHCLMSMVLRLSRAMILLLLNSPTCHLSNAGILG